MSRRCAIDTCQQSSRVLCYCCNENLCLEHLSTHKNSKSFLEQIKSFNEEVQKFDAEKFIERDRKKLNKWREESLKKIQRYYENKCEELDQFYERKIHEQRKEVDALQRRVIYYNQYEYSTTIAELKQKFSSIQQNGIPIHFRSLTIDPNCIAIGEFKREDFDLNELSLPYERLNIPKTATFSMTSSEKYFLIDQNSDLVLVDQDSRIVKQIPWQFGSIRDMCWSFALTSFILITEINKTYLLKEKTLSITCLESMANQLWILCTCSNSLLYLVSLNHAIVEFCLLPRLISNRRWDQPDTCQKFETIKDISSSDDLLALIITSEKTQMVHLILRSLATFDQIFSIQLDIVNHRSYRLSMRCCLFKKNQWLICDANTSRLFHIGKDGKVKGTFKYEQEPFHLAVFDSKILAIRTENTVDFHHL
ncbi:unnamed protein product [Adineta ricciae]|uniref:Uncharacterized protein n=1 Tax=Adineta ricciae TaxID=249248 RepID=A0A815CEF8_ADIRI|nr:unnamed protein product [Adineta ricciae]CAF1439585.1 unnamed protein product [Adineta ricciae]